MKKVLTIGSATEDIFIIHEDAEILHLRTKKSERSFLLLEQGIKYDVQKLIYATGGGATNSAVSFKRLGLDVTPCIKLGNDKAGQNILIELEKENIDTEQIIISHETSTAISHIIPTPEQNNTALCYRGKNTKVEPSEFPFPILPNYQYIYITSTLANDGKFLPELAKIAKENKLTVAANPGAHQIQSTSMIDSLKYIDILILNTHESKLLMQEIVKFNNDAKNKFDPEYMNQSNLYKNKITQGEQPQEIKFLRANDFNKQAQEAKSYEAQQNTANLIKYFMSYDNKEVTLNQYFNQIAKHGPSIVVLTDGANGVYVGTNNKIYFHKSIPAIPISAVGAGDAFGSTLVGALALKKDLEQAILYGVINASSVISHIDAKTGLLTIEELEKKANDIGLSGLEIFD